MTPEELRGFDGFENLCDEEAELIIDDLIAFARMVLEVVE